MGKIVVFGIRMMLLILSDFKMLKMFQEAENGTKIDESQRIGLNKLEMQKKMVVIILKMQFLLLGIWRFCSTSLLMTVYFTGLPQEMPWIICCLTVVKIFMELLKKR